MTKNDMNNVIRLKKMLGDESTASLSDIFNVIAKLPRSDEGGESFKVDAPVDVLHGYFAARNELWGITDRYFGALNNKVPENDFNDYFRCIEALPDIKMAGSVMHLMVWGLGRKEHKDKLAAFARQIPSFLSEGKWNKSISSFLAMRGAIDCVDYRQEGQTNVVLSIVRNRTGLERTVAAIAAISLVVRALSGHLDEEKGWRDTERHSRQIQLIDLYRTLEEENKECLKVATFHMIAPLLFGLDVEQDWKDTENCRNVGLPAQGRHFSYAEAIIVACASGIVLTRDECVKVCTLALHCADRSYVWRHGVFKPVANYIADLIARFDDSKDVWQDIRNATRCLIYRGLHECHTSATVSLYNHVEIFIWVAFSLVCDLCNKDRKGDAIEVWAPAWGECVTALYALTLIDGYVPLIQYFFVKAGMCFTNESELVPSGAELLEQLPLVEVRPDERIDCAEACIKALKGNLNDEALSRISAKDPDLARLMSNNSLSELMTEQTVMKTP